MSALLREKIFRYIFSLLALVIFIQGAVGQQNKDRKPAVMQTHKKQVKKKTEPQPLLRAVTVQTDVAGPFISKLQGSGISYYEASVDVNLRNKWFPIWEIGHASINHVTDEGGQFNAKGMYNRIGINVNLLNITDPKQITPSILYVGVRMGFAPFNYDIHNLPLKDEYWGNSTITNLDNLKSTAKWGELVAGIRLNVLKNITIGWSGRLKIGLSTGKESYKPWYVPGYGITGSSVWGFTYNIGYTIPLK
ncbi:MAG: hypothetical protein H6Q17_1390 [Bacteroidetes bacterium]|jgi:hypothetical protein|nr:hypothetical protein [Bacteroidota bacterium]